jgi:hypothetical protein
MYTRFILVFDLQSNQHHINPNYITSLEQKGFGTIVHMPDYSFETKDSVDLINQSIRSFDHLNHISKD